MCRSCAEGGRRCPPTEQSREAGKAASTRYYKRSKARLLIAQLSDHGIRAMDDTAMPPTYHVARSGKPLDLDDGGEVDVAEYALPDKPTGALWTSPGRVEQGGAVKSAWTDYDARESGSARPAESLHVVRAQPGAVIVSIETPEDAQALMDRYETQDQRGEKAFDWVAMKRDGIDGVYVSPSAVQGNSGHLGTAFGNLYGWDASSVAWLSNDNISVGDSAVEGGTYTVTVQEPEGDVDEGRMEWVEVSDDRMGQYDTPRRPGLDGAWDRVPKKVRESKAAQGADSTSDEASPEPEEDKKRPARRGVKVPKPKEYTEAVPPDQSLLDVGKEGIEFARALLAKKKEHKKTP